jgi:hypothetical protein
MMIKMMMMMMMIKKLSDEEIEDYNGLINNFLYHIEIDGKLNGMDYKKNVDAIKNQKFSQGTGRKPPTRKQLNLLQVVKNSYDGVPVRDEVWFPDRPEGQTILEILKGAL